MRQEGWRKSHRNRRSEDEQRIAQIEADFERVKQKRLAEDTKENYITAIFNAVDLISEAQPEQKLRKQQQSRLEPPEVPHLDGRII